MVRRRTRPVAGFPFGGLGDFAAVDPGELLHAGGVLDLLVARLQQAQLGQQADVAGLVTAEDAAVEADAVEAEDAGGGRVGVGLGQRLDVDHVGDGQHSDVLLRGDTAVLQRQRLGGGDEKHHLGPGLDHPVDQRHKVLIAGGEQEQRGGTAGGVDVVHSQHGEHQVGLLLSRTRLVDARDKRVLDDVLDAGSESLADEVRAHQFSPAVPRALVARDPHQLTDQFGTERQALVLQVDAQIEPVDE